MRAQTAIRFLAAGALITAVSGAALGQAAGEDFKKPLRSKAAQPSQNSSSSAKSKTVMRQDDGDNTVELRIEDGKYSAKLNGKEVPQDRIVREKDEVRIMDKDGNAVSTFHISLDGDSTTVFGQPPTPPKAPRGGASGGGKGGAAGGGPAGGAGRAWAPLTFKDGTVALPANPPKVMLGIHMDAPGEDVLKEFSVKEDEVILVTKVIDGLPADKAGLKENDVITEIDGKKPVNQDTLREVLKGKDPGDTVEFTVLRKGGDKSIRVTLDKYDPEKLGAAAMPAEGQPWGAFNNDDDARQAEKALREAIRGGHVFSLPGNGQQGFVMGAGPDMDRKLADLDKKMADLDKKLQRVDEQMAKLQTLIEKLTEQRSKK